MTNPHGNSSEPTGRDNGRRPVGFTISIDTEEDNWVPATTGITTRNIDELPRLAELFDELGVRPTYFTTYQVAVNARSAAVMRGLHSGTAEVAAHLHPWNTPPFSGIESTVSMLMSYPRDEQHQKIGALLDSLRAIGVSPTAFRAGRFGVGAITIGILADHGIRVDSSVTPLVSWREEDGGPSFLDAPGTLYRVGPDTDPCTPTADGPITEVPITSGYTRFRPSRWGGMARVLGTASARRLRMPGVANRLGIARKVILGPETHGASDMLRVSHRLIADGAKHLHMYLHSNSLVPGLTPFVRTRDDATNLLRTIRVFVERLGDAADIAPCTVSEAAALYGPAVGQAI